MSVLTPVNPAFAAFVAACGELSNPPKTSKVNAGPKSYHFAPLPEILDLARPVLARHALAVRFQTAPDANNILVTCEVVHATGVVVSAASLYSPSNANMQTVGSGLTYARRYTLVAALGIAADDDDDGEATARPALKAAPAQVQPLPARPLPADFLDWCKANNLKPAHVDIWTRSSGKGSIYEYDEARLSRLVAAVDGKTDVLAKIRGTP